MDAPPAQIEMDAEKVVKKRTKNSKKKEKNNLTQEQKREKNIDNVIKIKQELIAKAHKYDEEEYDLSTEEGMDEYLLAMDRRDRCRKRAVDFEQYLRARVDFEDLEEDAQHIDLIDVMHTVDEKMIITITDVEPLNKKLTEFINNPAADPECGPRDIIKADYRFPKREDIKAMLEQIREQGDCPILDEVAPAPQVNQAVYDEFVRKVLGDLSDLLKPKRFSSVLQSYEKEVRDRTAPGTSAELDEHPVDLEQAGKEDVQNGKDHSGGMASIHQRLLQAKLEGEIQEETDELCEDGEDIDGDDIDESETEPDERTRTNSALSSTRGEPELIDLTDDLDEEEKQDEDERASQSSSSSFLEMIEEEEMEGGGKRAKKEDGEEVSSESDGQMENDEAKKEMDEHEGMDVEEEQAGNRKERDRLHAAKRREQLQTKRTEATVKAHLEKLKKKKKDEEGEGQSESLDFRAHLQQFLPSDETIEELRKKSAEPASVERRTKLSQEMGTVHMLLVSGNTGDTITLSTDSEIILEEKNNIAGQTKKQGMDEDVSMEEDEREEEKPSEEEQWMNKEKAKKGASENKKKKEVPEEDMITLDSD